MPAKCIYPRRSNLRRRRRRAQFIARSGGRYKCAYQLPSARAPRFGVAAYPPAARKSCLKIDSPARNNGFKTESVGSKQYMYIHRERIARAGVYYTIGNVPKTTCHQSQSGGFRKGHLSLLRRTSRGPISLINAWTTTIRKILATCN